jgi:hypothetical protein
VIEVLVGTRAVDGVLQAVVAHEVVQGLDLEEAVHVARRVAEAVGLVLRVVHVLGRDEDHATLADGEEVVLIQFGVEEPHGRAGEPVKRLRSGLAGSLLDLVHRGEHLRSSRSV